MIDIVAITHESEIIRPLSPFGLHAVLKEAGLKVRSVTVLNAITGLTGSFRDDDVTREVP